MIIKVLMMITSSICMHGLAFGDTYYETVAQEKLDELANQCVMDKVTLNGMQTALETQLKQIIDSNNMEANIMQLLQPVSQCWSDVIIGSDDQNNERIILLGLINITSNIREHLCAQYKIPSAALNYVLYNLGIMLKYQLCNFCNWYLPLREEEKNFLSDIEGRMLQDDKLDGAVKERE